MTGDGGILLTNEPVDDVCSYFSKAQFDDFAKAGAVADNDVVIPAGKIRYHNTSEYISIHMEPMLKSLGMPVRLDKDCLVLDQDYTICKYGDRLTADQAHLLVSFLYYFLKGKSFFLLIQILF